MYFLAKYKRGVFNRYRKGMPWPEMLIKDIRVAWKRLLVSLGMRDGFVVLCFPHIPSRGSTIAQICKYHGWEITNRLDRSFHASMFWEYGTYREEFEPLMKLENVINIDSRNISKDFVDEAMYKTFGYATRIDPSSFEGTAVKKSLKNAVHDGVKVLCPVEQEEGFIYQKFIDSSVNDREVMDLRVVIMNSSITHLYLNYRESDQRFKNVPYRAELCEQVDTMLSKQEEETIISFCNEIGLMYGELDVLRDADDQKIYVVDANNTPQGPPLNLSSSEKERSIVLLAESFKKEFG